MSIVHYSARFLISTLQQLLNSLLYSAKSIATPVVAFVVASVVVVVVVVVVNGRSSKKLLHYECGKI